MSNSKIKVFVAMSGGVDSSVAAALLKKQGFDVVGVYMKPWTPNIAGICPWKQDREDAMRVAAILNIPFLIWDFSKEYKKSVADYMINEYKVGRTPNPDIMCNKHIKFGLFLNKAFKEGADYIATGHYARKAQIKNDPSDKTQGHPEQLVVNEIGPNRTDEKLKMKNYNSEFKIIYRLFKARDKNKDQSYFLWTLVQKQLKHCLFPIGNYTKPEVRKLARKFGLPNHDKKDSQGICFIGPVDMASFLKKYIEAREGKIMDNKGVVIGRQDGVYYYTIGQRHGLDIKTGRGPYYVTRKNLKKNIIYVGTEKDLYTSKAKITNINWISHPEAQLLNDRFIRKMDVKIRYRSQSEKAILHKNGDLKFIKPVRAITPGQSAVFYKESELLGGGIIL